MDNNYPSYTFQKLCEIYKNQLKNGTYSVDNNSLNMKHEKSERKKLYKN